MKKRCTTSIMPETFPGITFGDQGVCSLCNGKSLFRTEEAAIQNVQNELEQAK